MRNVNLLLLISLMTASAYLYAVDEHGHDHSVEQGAQAQHDDHESAQVQPADQKDEHAQHGDHSGESEGLKLSSDQRRAIGVEVQSISLKEIGYEQTVPGEVVLNKYQTSLITPRISAQILDRKAKLGEHVHAGQALLTLSSVEMAEVQGNLLVAAQELSRTEKLGVRAISARRHQESRVTYQRARAKAQAYGMTKLQIDSFLKANDPVRAKGVFQLLSPRDGTVLTDDFLEGEFVEPGRVLMTIGDETTAWIEAHLSGAKSDTIKEGAAVQVRTKSGWLDGRVIQRHHQLDETTRTQPIRIAVENTNDSLHPGQFVEVVFKTGEAQLALVVPLEAILRSPDGHWQVFVEDEMGHFSAKEVEVLRTMTELAVIDGLEPGTRVVIHGAYFLQSELAKSGFDIHNH